MKRQFTILGSILVLVAGLGWGQGAIAAPSGVAASSIHSPLGTDEIVAKLVEKNLARARALSAYQGTRLI